MAAAVFMTPDMQYRQERDLSPAFEPRGLVSCCPHLSRPLPFSLPAASRARLAYVDIYDGVGRVGAELHVTFANDKPPVSRLALKHLRFSHARVLKDEAARRQGCGGV